MINNFNLNEKLKEKTAKIDEKTPKNAEKVATKTISWGELLIICCASVFFLFALVSRVVYETYRTDDTSNTAVVVDGFTFKNNVLIGYSGNDTIINIPTHYTVNGEDYGITQIKDNLFYNNSTIEQVIMPNQITRIGLFVFRECRNLKSLTLSDSLESLGDSCFWNCVSLEEVHLPANLKKIEPYAFWNTSIKTIDIPANVESIGLGAFNRCSKLETVYIRHDSVVRTSMTEVYQTFSNCPNLQTIYVPAELVEQYKTHNLWSLYSDKFQPIGGVNA